jgi:polysaccharide export outer membrane protein
VLGDVTSPQRVTVDLAGLRLLEAIARAGGAKFPAFETVVTLQRRGRTEQVPLITVIRNPSQNVALQQGDSIVLTREPRSFLVLGATPAPGSIGGQNNRRFLFETENLTLAEALAKAGGLRTEQADARAVFIYRQESRETLRSLGVDVSQHKAERVPTIYQLDLASADGYFLATEFFIRDRDLVYISDAPAFEVAKVLGLIETAGNIALDSSRIAGN